MGRMAIYIIVFLFAIYGLYSFVQNIIIKAKMGCRKHGGKLCLFPDPGDEGLEGKIRCIFLDEIFEKTGTDGRLYIGLRENDPNKVLVEKLSVEYPRLVLLDRADWSKIEDGMFDI